MSERLPLFPLGTVLFPGLVLPLHVFEERYRALVRHLIRDDAEHGTFGVVAIRQGQATGDGDTAIDTGSDIPADITLHQIGCTAEIRQMTSHPDGRFDLVTVGRRRFRIRELHRGAEPFLQADIEWLSEPDEDPRADQLVPGVLGLFQRYLQMIRTDDSGGEQLPDDPAVLSYLIAATAVLAIDDRQELLAAATTSERLVLERRLLNREIVLLREISALPIPLGDLAVRASDN